MYAKSSNVIKKDSVINVYLDTLRNISEQLISRITGNSSFRKKKVLFLGYYKLIRMPTSSQSAFFSIFPRHGTFGVAFELGGLLKVYCLSTNVVTL